jgi:BirA family biotin operon repressor/biotin-[acetyl-CoA-carboxylase] ligase
MAAAGTTDFKIHAGTKHQKSFISAWMRFFHLKDIARSDIHVSSSLFVLYSFDIPYTILCISISPNRRGGQYIFQYTCRNDPLRAIIKRNNAKAVNELALKEDILLRLRENSGYLSGEELSGELNVSRTAVWKAVKLLRDCGYEIESVTNRGYRLAASPDILTPEEIKSGLETGRLAKNIYCYDLIDSTNEEAKRQALAGAPSGSLFIAEQQAKGKGRLGRSWASPVGSGLWFSLLLRSDLIPTRITDVTLLAGLAVCRAIRDYTGCPAMIKWPNDIVIGSKKVCGILTEMAAEMDRVDYVVVGIGINVNIEAFSEELKIRATSLRLETGKKVLRVGLLQKILREFDSLLCNQDENEHFLKEYKDFCVSLNRKVGFTRDNECLTGTAVDISQTGELIVQCDDGMVFPVSSGEVTVQGIYGK